MPIEKIIEQIQESVFKYDVKSVQNNIMLLIQQVENLVPQFDQSQTNHMNEILILLNTAMTNSDHLLLADVLQYELLPFIQPLNN